MVNRPHAHPIRPFLAVPAAALALGVAGVVAHRSASARFHATVEALERTLLGSAPAFHVRRDLPAAIEGFARRNAGIDGDWIEARPVAWCMDQGGAMRSEPDGPWLSFAAEQTIALRESGFVWFAEFDGPGPFDTRVVDAFVSDRGLLEARIEGSLRVARVVGPEADIAEACRYLAELPWTPLAILANQFVHWERLGDDLYGATVHTGAGPATIHFHMWSGDIVRAEAEERMRAPGRYLPWRGTFSSYAQLGGVRVPLNGEVGWVEGGEYRPYWRGDVLAGRYAH